MRKYSIAFLLFITIHVGFQFTFAQSTFNKRGGVGFRVDDNQTAQKWRDFNRVFNKYGLKFSLGIDVQRLTFDTAALNAIREIAASGHELMDHTPYGSTCILWVKNLRDTLHFLGHPAVDHINKNRICLRYDTLNLHGLSGEGKVNLIGNKLISQSPGEFKNMYNPAYFSMIYLPEKDKLCTWYNLENKNSSDPDTLLLRTFWQETFPNDTAYNLSHHRLSGYDVKLKDISLNLLIEYSLDLFDSLQLPRPYTWVQPGGACPQLNATEVKNEMGKRYGYTAACTYVNTSFKMYNEVDTMKLKRFAIQNPDFSDENLWFSGMIKLISDNSARHLQSLTLGHFQNPVGGWDAYLGRIDSLLSWCLQNDIPVRTINQWASVMYDSIPNPYVNAIPELFTDLNKDGTPDGITGPFGTIDSTGGATRSKNYCITRTNSGGFFSVNIQGGVEKGVNRLSMFTKGMNNDSIRIFISYPELPGVNQIYNLAANTVDWKEVSRLISIDPRASRVTLQLNAIKNTSTGTIGMSGVQLRKESKIQIRKDNLLKVTTNRPFPLITASSVIADSVYQPFAYSLNLLGQAKVCKVAFDTSSMSFRITKPNMFWVGTDSVRIAVANRDGYADTGYIRFMATTPVICRGDSVLLEPDTTLGSNFSWTGYPGKIAFWVKPVSTSVYYCTYTNRLNQPVNAYVQVLVDQVKPKITLPPDTLVCPGIPFTLQCKDYGNITWYQPSGNMLFPGNKLLHPAINKPAVVFINNRINTCELWDTLRITPGQMKALPYRKRTDSTNVNQSLSHVFPGAKYATVTFLNTTIHNMQWDSGTLNIIPRNNYAGVDSILFQLQQPPCATDSVWFVLKVYIPAGIDEIPYNKIKVYPNPAREIIQLQSPVPFGYKLYNLQGALLKTSDEKLLDGSINMRSFSPGTYLLMLESEDEVLWKKIIKED